MKKTILATLLLAGLAGCSTAAYPGFINGQYYMVGDTNCKRYNPVSNSRIQCLTSKSQSTGYRDAMTLQQIQMYQMMLAQQQAADAQMAAQIAANNQAMHNATMARYNNQQMIIPQVNSYDNRNQVRCISTGFYTNCRQY